MKASKGKKKTTRVPIRSRLRDGAANPAFMANAKSEKDNVQGWAFDFSNPDAGQGQTPDEDAIIEQVKKESLKEANQQKVENVDKDNNTEVQ